MCHFLARTASPSNMVPRISPSSISVRFARTARGSRKSGTPLAIASTPVNALQPAEKALRTRSTVTALSEVVGSVLCPSWLSCSPSGWMRPTAMMARSPTTNTNVGSRKARAVSPRPRRLRRVMTKSVPRHIGIVAESRLG